MATNGSPNGRVNQVPQPPNYPPSNSAPRPATGAAPAPARAPRNRTNKIEINKLNLVPDVSMPPLSFSYSKTTVVQGGPGYGGVGKALPGSGFTSDEDIRAYCEALRKEARPKAVERSLDAEVLNSVLRVIPDVHGSLSGSRGRARRVVRHLKRISAAEKLIGKQAAALYATFTREFEAELKSRVSPGRARNTPHRPVIWKS